MNENQKRYLFEMFDMKAHIIYYSKCLSWCKGMDKWCQIIVSLISIIGISSIQYKLGNSSTWYWVMLIAQLFALIISLHFDFKDKIIKIDLLLKEINSLYLEMIDNWYKVSKGEITEEAIHKLWIDYKTRNDSLETPDGTIGWFWYMSSSEKEAKTYFDKYYPKE